MMQYQFPLTDSFRPLCQRMECPGTLCFQIHPRSLSQSPEGGLRSELMGPANLHFVAPAEGEAGAGYPTPRMHQL